ncbi:hypothetical protein CsatB_030065 [Cannabis sativa]
MEWNGNETIFIPFLCLVAFSSIGIAFQWNALSTILVEWLFHFKNKGMTIPM